MNAIFQKRDAVLSRPHVQRAILAAGAVSLAVYFLVQVLTSPVTLPYSAQMVAAARLMAQTIGVVRDHCDRSRIAIDPDIDPNRTGLVGPKHSGLTTTLGQLEAKRTTTNPDMAGVMVHLLHQAGVTAGDTIAIGASGSFPALLVATLAAARVMNLQPVVILSLGSSSYGAGNEEFTLLHLVQLLHNEGLFPELAASVSLGGEGDIGLDFEPGVAQRLQLQVTASGLPFIHEPELGKNVARRMQFYFGHAAQVRVAAFINMGGNTANLGTSELVLALKPGLNPKLALPPPPERGVLFEMAARGVPCIHLLFIKGLAQQYGLPWDPVPLPAAGTWALSTTRLQHNPEAVWVSAVYLAALLLLAMRVARHQRIRAGGSQHHHATGLPESP